MLEERRRAHVRHVSMTQARSDDPPRPPLLVCGISQTRGRADSILVDMLDDGIASGAIAVLFRDPDASVALTPPDVPAPESSGAIRGVIAFLPGVRRVLIRTPGPVILSGGLAATAESRALDGLPQVLQQFGVPPAESERFAHRIAAGQFFIAVRTALSATRDRARDILLAGRADELFTGDEIPAVRTDGARLGESAHPSGSTAEGRGNGTEGRTTAGPAVFDKPLQAGNDVATRA